MPLPRWLEQRLRRPRSPEPGEQLAARAAGAGQANRLAACSDGLIRFVAASREGERNQRLFWAACRAAELGDATLRRRLVEAARQAGLSEFEAQQTIASAFRTAGKMGAA